MTPAPLQVGQAPSELALNSAGFTPLALANALRIGSSSPVYVAGLLRREPRMGLWSTDTTPSPAGIEPCTSELLPEPATPVTTASTPSGMSTSTFAQVVRRRAADLQRAGGLAHRLLERGPVVEVAAGDGAAGPQPLDGALEADGAAAVPAPGPRSTTWSAMAIVSGLCSTTSTVLPLSRSRSSSSFIRWMSCGCRPMVGSSKTYVTSVSEDPRWRIILTRCASPPDRVPAGPVEREVAEADLHERVEGLAAAR